MSDSKTVPDQRTVFLKSEQEVVYSLSNGDIANDLK